MDPKSSEAIMNTSKCQELCELEAPLLASEEPARAVAQLSEEKKTQLRRDRASRQRGLLNVGASSWTDSQLLQEALALASPPGRDTGGVAASLLCEFGTVGSVLNASTSSLLAVPGVAEQDARTLKTIAFALSCILRNAAADGPIFGTCEDLKNYLVARLRHKREHLFLVLYLDAEQRLIGDELLARGTTNFVTVDSREVIRRCLELNARSLLIVSNHPSGSAQPGWKEMTLTEELVKAAALFRICVVDHVIVASAETFSFCEGGLGNIITGQPTVPPRNEALH